MGVNVKLFGFPPIPKPSFFPLFFRALGEMGCGSYTHFYKDDDS